MRREAGKAVKLEKLRVESDSNLSRAEKAEAEVKELKNELAKRETDVHNHLNKIQLLQMDLERAEKRADDNKLEKSKSDKDETLNEALQRKIQMLEQQLDAKEHDRKEAVDRARSLELQAETFERKAKQLDAEKLDLERRLEEMTKKYEQVKGELDQTLKDLEGL
ncbi:tropomyosin-2 [Polyrhizophydium stewartii]|uniref:Tropomyosin-2 n=1 Tax=Polyrhizophydium stewartii TaxID=2732419 RepID=A0ABR4NA92_9FUNG